MERSAAFFLDEGLVGRDESPAPPAAQMPFVGPPAQQRLARSEATRGLRGRLATEIAGPVSNPLAIELSVDDK